MPVLTGPTQLTPLLSNEAVARLERLRLNSSRRFTDKRRGEHVTGRGGTSIEFSDYRNYVAGDDVRFVDWNIFARLHRPYLKLYRQEEEMHVVLLVDASTSMLFEDKLDMARRLAAAFGIMGLFGTERVSLYALGHPAAGTQVLAPCTGRASMMKLFRTVEGLEGGGAEPLEIGIEALLRRHTGRGVAVILSDFLTFGDLNRAGNRLFGAGLEVWGIQILGPAEIAPDVTSDIRLVDGETRDTLDATCNADLLRLYHEYRTDHERHIATLCRQRAGRFVTISATADVDAVLFDLLRRRGWIR